MADVRLENISKGYGKTSVLRNMNLAVEAGECFTLLGPSGCGKTVLTRLMAGFESPDSGRVLMGGRAVSDPARGVNVPPDERRLGVVFQDYAVWPHMNVFDNVAYPLKIAGVPGAQIGRRVCETLEMVNLAGLEKRLPSQLSGGQQQRVALARALTAKPSILLLDEPLCNLDANLREEMRFEIRQLQKALGITVFYVTHDQEVALAISDRLAIMDESGVVRQMGPPEEVYENPADSFVFRFLGVANFLPARREGAVCRTAGGQPFGRPVPDRGPDDLVAGFRPTDVVLARGGPGIAGTVRRVSFLGATTDYLVDVEGHGVRTQIPTHRVLDRDLLLAEGEHCVLNFRAVHWFDDARPQKGE